MDVNTTCIDCKPTGNGNSRTRFLFRNQDQETGQNKFIVSFFWFGCTLLQIAQVAGLAPACTHASRPWAMCRRRPRRESGEGWPAGQEAGAYLGFT